jgi:ADP-heptose:LPS heptosyltransferase
VSSSEHILVPIVAGIGNAIMAVPMVRQLKRNRAGHRLTILARSEPMGDVFRRQKCVDEVVVCGKSSWAMVREARRRKGGLYVVPFPSNRWQYNALQFSSGAKQRLMHGYPIGKFAALSLLPASRVEGEQGVHDVIQNLRLLEGSGMKVDYNDKPDFPLGSDDHAGASGLLKQAGLKRADGFVVMHAGSAQTEIGRAKRWPAPLYAMLAQAITRIVKLPTVLVEGPDEAGVSDEITKHIPEGKADVRKVKLAGPLGETAALLSYARAYVGSDSGLAHLSAAVGTPPVTLFAPSDPERVCPFGYRSLVVQVQKMCSPCFAYPWKSCGPRMQCSAPYCIEEIGVEPVMNKLKMALEKSA